MARALTLGRRNEGDGKAKRRTISGLSSTVVLFHDTHVVVAVNPSLRRTFLMP